MLREAPWMLAPAGALFVVVLGVQLIEKGATHAGTHRTPHIARSTRHVEFI